VGILNFFSSFLSHLHVLTWASRGQWLIREVDCQEICGNWDFSTMEYLWN